LTFAPGPDGDLYAATIQGTVSRYDGTTGDFKEIFISSGSGGLAGPRDMIFRDGWLYVASINSDEVLRYDLTMDLSPEVFVSAGLGGLDAPDGMAFSPDGDGPGFVGGPSGPIGRPIAAEAAPARFY